MGRLIMANVDDRVTLLRQRILLRRAREPIDSLELYRLQHEERIEGASEIVPSISSGDDSASGDDGEDDSVIEVFPTPKKSPRNRPHLVANAHGPKAKRISCHQSESGCHWVQNLPRVHPRHQAVPGEEPGHYLVWTSFLQLLHPERPQEDSNLPHLPHQGSESYNDLRSLSCIDRSKFSLH